MGVITQAVMIQAAIDVRGMGPPQKVALADEIFSTLMGEDVEARRNFIQQNARDVRFLDI